MEFLNKDGFNASMGAPPNMPIADPVPYWTDGSRNVICIKVDPAEIEGSNGEMWLEFAVDETPPFGMSIMFKNPIPEVKQAKEPAVPERKMACKYCGGMGKDKAKAKCTECDGTGEALTRTPPRLDLLEEFMIPKFVAAGKDESEARQMVFAFLENGNMAKWQDEPEKKDGEKKKPGPKKKVDGKPWDIYAKIDQFIESK